jgi:hypothetical protein
MPYFVEWSVKGPAELSICPLFIQKVDRVSDQTRWLRGSNFDKAMRILQNLACDEMYVYAMGQEPLLAYISSFRYNPESNPFLESNKYLTNAAEEERLYGEREILLNPRRQRKVRSTGA